MRKRARIDITDLYSNKKFTGIWSTTYTPTPSEYYDLYGEQMPMEMRLGGSTEVESEGCNDNKDDDEELERREQCSKGNTSSPVETQADLGTEFENRIPFHSEEAERDLNEEDGDDDEDDGNDVAGDEHHRTNESTPYLLDQPIYDGSQMTLKEFLVSVASIFTRSRMSNSFQDDTLSLLRAVTPQGRNLIPRSSYLFHQWLERMDKFGKP